MPWSPLASRYLMWLSVLKTKMSLPSHAPLLIRIVSWIMHTCSSLRVRMTMACLESSATCDMSDDQMTYLTTGVVTSAIALRCWMSKSVMRSSLLSSIEPVPAG